MGINIPNGNQNKFFGQKVSKPGINVYNSSDADLIYKNDYNKTTYFGTLTSSFQIGNFDDDSSNGARIYDTSGVLVSQFGQQADKTTSLKFYNSNGNLTFGQNLDGTYGMQTLDPSGNLLFSMSGQTWKWYDVTTKKNVMQVGLLPDGTYGMVIAKPGVNVADLY